ncbi:hypothetical protein [Mucilaginibacter frigoritolerans]|jgi:hypothetical protein|nr:hypothetical protein [Mucilaginibacter frigoritolerans]
MKAFKVLAIVLLAAFSFTAASARPVHHKKHYHRKHRPVVAKHHR